MAVKSRSESSSLSLVHSGQALGGPLLKAFCPLAAGDVQRALKVSFSVLDICGVGIQ